MPTNPTSSEERNYSVYLWPIVGTNLKVQYLGEFQDKFKTALGYGSGKKVGRFIEKRSEVENITLLVL
jgi:hypothetical protein